MTTIKLRRGTAAEWTTNNPILAAGEMGIETDTRKFKFGDGTTPWNTLAYASAEGGGGTGDVTAAGDNTFTGENTFNGAVNLNGVSIAENLTVKRNLTSNGEINAVSIKTTGLRSDDIQTTTNKKYLTEVDVDNQTIQMVDGKLHANLDNKQDKLTAGNGIDIRKTLDGVMNYDWYLNDVSLNPVPSTISSPEVGTTNIYKPYNNQVFSNTANEINITFDVLYANMSSSTVSYVKATGTNGEITISFDGAYHGGDTSFDILCTINSSTIINVRDIKIPYYAATYIRYIFTFNRTTKIWSIIVKNTSNNIEIYSNSGSTSVDIIPTDSLITIGMKNVNGSKNDITVKTDTFSVSSSLEEITLISANLDDVTEQIDILKGTKQDILFDGNGTKVVDNKVDIYQGDAGIRGLTLYQNNGTITKNNDLSITFNNGACGYIFLENKGVNNDYEIVLHQSYLGTHGPGQDSNIIGVRCLPQAIVPTPGTGAQGECWVDTFESPFRVIAVPNGGAEQQQTVSSINYIKYIIKGTNLTISRSPNGVDYTELYTISISSTYAINVYVANSPWQNDIDSKWTNTTLYSDSYVLDKTTNTYLMKQGISDEGVAVATSTKYGLVLPDNSTIVSNNGVMSVVPSTIASYSMPSNRYINLTPGANGTSYIAPADGLIAFAKKLTATGQYVGLSNNTIGISIMGCNASDGSGGNTSCFIPCKKGDEVVTWYSAGGDVLILRFIYAEGAQ